MSRVKNMINQRIDIKRKLMKNQTSNVALLNWRSFGFMTFLLCMLSMPVQAQSLNAPQAISLAKAKYPGKVLKTKKQSSGGQSKYHIKIIQKNGRVINVTVDGKTRRVNKH